MNTPTIPPEFVILPTDSPERRAEVLDAIRREAITRGDEIEQPLRQAAGAIAKFARLLAVLEQQALVKRHNYNGDVNLHADVRERGPIYRAIHVAMAAVQPSLVEELVALLDEIKAANGGDK